MKIGKIKLKRSSKQSRWQKEQRARKDQQSRLMAKWGLLFFGLVAVLVCLSFLWKEMRLSIWDGQSMINIVIQSEAGLQLQSYRPDQRRWLVLVMPNNTQTQMPFGYGQYQLKSVYALGELDDRGGELLRRTVQDMLGLPVGGWLVKLEGGRQTNLSWWDELRLWVGREWQSRKQIEIILTETGVLKEERLKDETVVYRVEIGLLDELINKEFFDQRLVDEGLSVALVNSSGVEGIAKTAGRLATNLGSQLVWLGNDEKILKNSLVLVDSKDQLRSLTARKLAEAFGIELIELGEVALYRADVVLLLGLDYAQGE